MQLVMDMDLPVHINFKVNYKMSEQEIIENYHSILEANNVKKTKVVYKI